MRLGGYEQCQLFLTVYPAFVEALPIISSSSNTQSTDIPVSAYTLSLDNLITELRDEIKKIGITFNEEDTQCELHDELFQDARDALDQILFLFEDLVHDGITEKNPNVYGNEVCFESLDSLVDMLIWSDTAAIDADIPQTRKTEAQNIERICPDDIRHDIVRNRAEIVPSGNLDGAPVQPTYEEDTFQCWRSSERAIVSGCPAACSRPFGVSRPSKASIRSIKMALQFPGTEGLSRNGRKP